MNQEQFGINDLNLSKAARKYLKQQPNQSAAFLAGSVYADMEEENQEYLSAFVQSERNRDAVDVYLAEKGFTEILRSLEFISQIISRIRIALRANTRCAENALQSVYLDDIGEIDLSSIQSPTLTLEAYSEAKNRLLDKVYKAVILASGYEVDLPYDANLSTIVVAMDRAWQSNNSLSELEAAIKAACKRGESPEQEEAGEPTEIVLEEEFDFDEELFNFDGESIYPDDVLGQER